MQSYSIKDLAGIVVRANLSNESAVEVLLSRILEERDQVRDCNQRLAECLHASALIVRSIPEFDEELQRDLQQMSARVIRAVAKAIASTEAHAHDAPPVKGPTPVPKLNEMSLGGILTELGIVNEDDIQAALQLSERTGKLLGQSLVELGRANTTDIDNALELQKVLVRSAPGPTATKAPTQSAVGDALLGEIMLRSDRIDEGQLNQALKLQRERGIRIGEALVELGAATWTDVTEAIREQVRRRGGAASGNSAA